MSVCRCNLTAGHLVTCPLSYSAGFAPPGIAVPTAAVTPEGFYVGAAQPQGAVAMAPATWCPECGPNVACDEDGCCAACGATCTGKGAVQAMAALAEVERLRAEVATLTDKALRFDLDRAGIESREREAVELVDLRAEVATLRMGVEHLASELEAERAAPVHIRTETADSLHIAAEPLARRVEELSKEPRCTVYTTFCHDHNFVHGAEAEELRKGVERLIACGCGVPRVRLIELLDRVDARDSLAFLDARAPRPTGGEGGIDGE